MTIHKGARIVETINVSVIRLSTLFRRYLPKNTVIDFLSLDVEGGELDVLQGNDWEIYRPMWMMIEVMISGMGIFDFLSAIGYSAVWCNSTNALFLTEPRIIAESQLLNSRQMPIIKLRGFRDFLLLLSVFTNSFNLKGWSYS